MLNKSQEKAVYTKEPFLFLLAGAGTGKTRVIVERIKHLINTGVDPNKILAITFTNRASKEMSKRINNPHIAVHTFHQFCYQKLKECTTYDYYIVSEGLRANDKSLLQIAKYKNSFFKEKKPKKYDEYARYLKENNLKDFDDLLIDFHNCFHQIKRHLNYEYIFVDEFQDTNTLQYMIIKKLITKDTHVMCVGDPDQSIYKFRGANAKIIDMFIEDYKAKVFRLTTNYRSTQNILTLANSLIKQNNSKYQKRLLTDKTENYVEEVICYKDQNEEANHVLKRIIEHLKKGVKVSDIAVLYRNHNRVYTLREILDKNDIQYCDDISNSDQKNALNLLSLHQAKGLEFSVVFIVGLEQGSLPSYHVKTNADLQEERRLFFVGITRAKKYLYLSFTQFNNDAEHVVKSMFLRPLKGKLHHR